MVQPKCPVIEGAVGSRQPLRIYRPEPRYFELT